MRKNVAGQKVGAQMCSSTDGSNFTGSVTVYVTIDAGTQAIGTVGSGVCTHEGNGYHTYSPSQAETNGDLVAFTFIGTGAVSSTVQVYTRPSTGLLAPTVADRTLDVSSDGEAGIDWANVGSPTTTLNLSGTTVKTATDVEAGIVDIQSRLPASLTGGRMRCEVESIVNAAISSDAFDVDWFTASGIAASAVNEIGAGVAAAIGVGSADLDTQLGEIKADTETLLARITSTLFSGITSLGDWIRRIARKDSGTAGMIAAEAEIDTGGTSTFTGTTDSLEAIRDATGGGGGGDQWTTDTSTGYTYPEAGAMLKTIYDKASLITAGGVVNTSNPVNTNGQITRPIIIGDDYKASIGSAFTWDIPSRTGFVVATATCRFGGSSDDTTTTWNVTGTVSDNGDGTWELSFDLPKATTSALEAGLYRWSVEIANAGGDEVTEVYNSTANRLVEVRSKQT